MVILARLVETTQCFVFKDRNMKIATLENETTVLPQMSGSNHPVTHHHIPQERRPEDGVFCNKKTSKRLRLQ
jgi:hypothetical protein